LKKTSLVSINCDVLLHECVLAPYSFSLEKLISRSMSECDCEYTVACRTVQRLGLAVHEFVAARSLEELVQLYGPATEHITYYLVSFISILLFLIRRISMRWSRSRALATLSLPLQLPLRSWSACWAMWCAAMASHVPACSRRSCPCSSAH
jgi:hypothetical protein